MITKSAFASLLCAAALTLTGCPTGLGAAIPGTGGTLGGGTTTTPGGTTTTPATGAAACTRTTPSGNPTPGTSVHGAYNAQLLPDGWATAHKSQADVTAAIAKLATADLQCFEKFYQGAFDAYNRVK